MWPDLLFDIIHKQTEPSNSIYYLFFKEVVTALVSEFGSKSCFLWTPVRHPQLPLEILAPHITDFSLNLVHANNHVLPKRLT